MVRSRILLFFALAAILLGQSLLTITTTSPLPYGTVGSGYSTALTASGGSGSYLWSIPSGTLPPGLSLTQNTGVISGTPATAGTYLFTVMVLDLKLDQTTTKPFSIGIPQITTASALPNGTTGAAYSATFNASDAPAPFTWFISAGSLPPGLGLDQSLGILSGTPTTAGTYNFAITASSNSSKASATKSFSLAVGSGLTITSASALPNGDAGSLYKTALSASGGTPPYRWSITSGSLAAGLSLDSSSGIISGFAAAGTYSFSLQVSDSAGANSIKAFAIVINPPLTITTTSPLPNGTVGVNYSRTIAVSGGMAPYAFTFTGSTPFGQSGGGLPPGITLNPNGVISGVPTMSGTSNFTIVVTDAINSQASALFALTIAGPLAIATASPLPAGITGAPYSQNITATGGMAPYTFALRGTLPPGLTLSAGGALSGTPTSTGTFTFTVAATDSSQTTITAQFQITITSLMPPVQASPLSLTFSPPSGGDSPALQSITILSTTSTPANFTIQIDGGTANSAAPQWLMVSPMSGTTPGRLVVSIDPNGMAAGTYMGRIRIMPQSNTGLPPVDIPVTLSVSAMTPQLDVTPAFVRLAARAQAPGALEQVIVVRNSGGGGSTSFSASIAGQSAWITDVSPGSGQTVQNSPIFLRVHINTQGLQVGSYHDVIHLASPAGSVDVPISLFVAGSGPILSLNVTGVRFRIKQGSGTTQTQTINVLNLGDPAATINFKADLLSGSEWLSLGMNANRTGPPIAGILLLLPNGDAAGFAPGAYYALVRVTDLQAPDSPQYLTAVLEVADVQAPAFLEPSPAGLFFAAPAGAPAPAGQTVRLFTSNTDPVPFQASADTRDGANWLSATPSSGQATTQSPGQLTVTVNPAGLSAGIYTGHVNIAFGGSVRAVNVTFVVTPAASASTTPIRAAQGCTPSRIAITETGLPDSFAVPAKWPANLIVQLNDQCGTPVLNGSVVASFSNGDAPLTLRGDMQTGAYSATWQPGVVTPQMTVTVRAAAGSLEPATAQLVGGISQNRAPVLAKNGTVNALNRVSGGALAPSTIVEVYGSDLASITSAPDMLPLPTISNGTFLVVGPVQTPLYFLSNGQLDAQIPAELVPNKQYSMVVSANRALTLPETIDVVPVQPGLAALPDGHVIAQHAADFTLVDSAHPAKPGEFLVIYLSGMGATNPVVPSGSASPAVEPLARLSPQPSVKVGGQDADILFAGLTPGLVGLYQINLRVPANVSAGDLDLVIKQGDVSSNTTKLPVGQ